MSDPVVFIPSPGTMEPTRDKIIARIWVKWGLVLLSCSLIFLMHLGDENYIGSNIKNPIHVGLVLPGEL